MLLSPLVFGFWPVLIFLIVLLEVSADTNSALISYVFFIDTLTHETFLKNMVRNIVEVTSDKRRVSK